MQGAAITVNSKQPEPSDQVERGLTTQEAKERLAKVGPNEQASARRAAGLIQVLLFLRTHWYTLD